jgi:polar amino acid transport system permease protein
MTISEVFTHLLTWTPFLLEGFGWNILIATLASVLGTLIGALLVWMRLEGSPRIMRTSSVISTEFYKIPTLALMFYCAVLLPNELQIPGTELIYPFPSWIKAALALSAAQVGFTANNLAGAIHFWRKGEHGAALLFIPSWGSNLLITIIASSSASLVGVSEIVSRCNKVINASNNTDLLIPIYLYASLFFLVFCYPLTLAMKKLKKTLLARVSQRTMSIPPVLQGEGDSA